MAEFVGSLFGIAIVGLTIAGFWNHWYWVVPVLFFMWAIYDKISTEIESEKRRTSYVPPVYVPIKMGMTEKQVRNDTEFGCYVLDYHLTQTLTTNGVIREYTWDKGKLVFENGILTQLKQWNTW